MEDWMDDFEYLLMPSARPLAGHEKEYFAAYECWRASWLKFRTEVGSKEKLFSDSFTNTDELGVLFYKGECVGLHAFRTGSLLDGTIRDAAWFAPWSALSLEKLMDISPLVTISSQFTIHPSFAGKNQVVRWKKIGAACTINRFLNSSVPVMAGFLNISRGMTDVAGADSGAIVLNSEEGFQYSENVTIMAQPVAYTRESLLRAISKNRETEFYAELWKRTRFLSELHTKKLKLVA